MSEQGEHLEKARAAVRAAYGAPESAPPADEAHPEEALPGGVPVVQTLDRARLLAQGAPGPARRRSSMWRRGVKAVLGRLIRFETAWQHEFNRTTVEALENLVGRIEAVTNAAARLESRLQEVSAAQRHLLARLDEEALKRQDLAAALNRDGRHRRREEEALRSGLEEQAGRLESEVARLEERADSQASASKFRDRTVKTTLEGFRGEVARILQGGENIRHALIDAARRIRLVERGVQAASDLAPRMEEIESNLRSQIEAARRAVEVRLEEGAVSAGAERDRLAAGLRADLARAETVLRKAVSEEAERGAAHRQRLDETAGRVAHLEEHRRREEMDFDQLAFAERFRGSGEQIRGRLQPYVDLFREADTAHGGRLLEIGPGRGEFLVLCREAGLPACGVDQDAAAVTLCRDSGLDVVHAGALEHLGDLQDGSLGGVFAAQVIEHLLPGELQQMLAQAHRALAPGGLIILETLNPACLSVLATTFYRDPTHRNPLHPDTAVFLLESAGFGDVRALSHTPVAESHKLAALPPDPAYTPGLEPLREAVNRQVERLNDLLFGDQEYHVIGVRR